MNKIKSNGIQKNPAAVTIRRELFEGLFNYSWLASI